MKKISVIIPIFNAEKTLPRCLESIVKQSFDDYELILVNDGSTDSSASICNEYLSKYPQIRYLYKKNGGVSSARNMGIAHAGGEYVAFIDSDDYVTDDFFKVISNSLSKKPDLLILSAKAFGGASYIRGLEPCFENDDVKISKRVLKAMKAYSYSSSLSKLFKRSIIAENSVCFDEGLSIGEDQVFLFEFTLHTKSFACTGDVVYMIDVSSDDSLSRKRRDYLTKQLLDVNTKMLLCLNNASLSEAAYKNYQAAVSWITYRSAYSCFIELEKYNFSLEKKLDKINEICNAFNKSKIEPQGFRCKAIAFPIKNNMCSLINIIITAKSRLL